MGLRVEEYFGMADVLSGCFGKVVPGESFKVVGGDEYARAEIVVVEEIIEAGEALISRYESLG